MRSAIVALALAITAQAGGSWIAKDKLHPASDPIDMSKYKEVELRCYADVSDDKFIFRENKKTKIVITQEKPCLFLDKSFKYKKKGKNRVEIYEEIAIKGYDMLEDKDYTNAVQVLGPKKCKLKGKEHWIVYQLNKGKWQKVCETTFKFK